MPVHGRLYFCGQHFFRQHRGLRYFFGTEETASDVEYIKDKGTLVVGITEFAPMDYKDDNGEWIGFDADMAREVADALGVEVQFTVIEWGNKLLELENKSIDCAWNGMTITDEITEGASATNPYAKNAQVVVVKKMLLTSTPPPKALRACW